MSKLRIGPHHDRDRDGRGLRQRQPGGCVAPAQMPTVQPERAEAYDPAAAVVEWAQFTGRGAAMKTAKLIIIAGVGLLGGCATNFAGKAATQCQAVAAYASAYADCVRSAEAEMQSNHQRTWRAIAAGLGGAASASRPATGAADQRTISGSAIGTAFLQNSHVSGLNRICQYNRLGSAYVITVRAAQMCPMTVR